MEYGPQGALVEEVIAFVSRGEVFSPTASVVAPGALVITDLEEAKEYAWYRPIGDDEGPNWTSLREEEIAPFHAVPYERPELKPAYDAVRALTNPFHEQIRPKLPPQLIDDVAGDLKHCAMNRALHGLVPDSFWERVWQVYRQGAWPCGWEGDYPAGRMVIYQPPPTSSWNGNTQIRPMEK